MNDDYISIIGDLLTNNETTTATTTTAPSGQIDPLVVGGIAIIILSLLGFAIYKLS